MLLQRTEKARIELLPGPRTLGLRERSVLMLANGDKSLMDLEPLFGGEGWQIALDLVRQGYLEPRRASRAMSGTDRARRAPRPPAIGRARP